MGNIHINSNGEPGACKATKGGCPFGSSDTHFDNAEQAANAYAEAQNAMGNNGLSNKTDAFKGAASYADNKIDAERIANIIANEGKIAVIAKVSKIHLNEVALPGGLMDSDEYDSCCEDDDEEHEDEDDSDYEQAVEDIAQAAIDEDFSSDDFDEPDIGQVSHHYLVRAFDNDDQVKEYNKTKDWSSENYKTVDIDMDNPNNESDSEFTSDTDLNTSDLTVTKINVSVIRPKTTTNSKTSSNEDLTVKQSNAKTAFEKGFPNFEVSKTDRTKIEKIIATGKVTDKVADELLQDREILSLRNLYDDREKNESRVESVEKVFDYIQTLRDQSDKPSTLKKVGGFDPSTETILSNPIARKNPYIAAKSLKKNMDESNRLNRLASERFERMSSVDGEYEKTVLNEEMRSFEIQSNRLLARSEAISKEMLWLAENDETFKSKVDAQQLRSLQNIVKNIRFNDMPVSGVKVVK